MNLLFGLPFLHGEGATADLPTVEWWHAQEFPARLLCPGAPNIFSHAATGAESAVDAPTIDWLESQEFPTQPLFYKLQGSAQGMEGKRLHEQHLRVLRGRTPGQLCLGAGTLGLASRPYFEGRRHSA